MRKNAEKIDVNFRRTGTLKPDSKDVYFTSKRANCSFYAACKLKNDNFRPKLVKMLISR